MKIRVAFFVVSLNAGGIENYLLRFIKFYKNKIEATVYCKSGRIGELEDEYIKETIRIKKFKIGYINVFDFLRLRKELNNEGYTAVVDFTGNFAGFTMFCGKLAGIDKRIAWYRNADDKFKRTAFKIIYNSIINRITRKYASNILSNSKAALNYFYKDYLWQNDKRFEVIYNGLDARGFLTTDETLREEFNIPNTAFVVGNVGRFNEQKNHRTAIRVAIKLCKEYEDIYFIFCGKGVDEEYNSLIKESKLEKRIILTGMRRDVIKVLNSMNCFYFPSILEGQPNALIEAMVAGVPFVASDIEPVKETVPQNLHNYLVPPLDAELAIQSILKIKEDVYYRKMFLIQDWAIDNFNSDIQFKKFYNKIENEI